MATRLDSKTAASLFGGMAGATVLTLVHQGARAVTDDAPRMDELGRRVIRRAFHGFGLRSPKGLALQSLALAGDLVANTAYYALIGAGGPKRAWLRGAGLGALAGAGALVLPPLMGLGKRAQARTVRTQVMTFTWYLLGGLTAGALYSQRFMKLPTAWPQVATPAG